MGPLHGLLYGTCVAGADGAAGVAGAWFILTRPKYFGDVCTPVHTVAARSRLRSAYTETSSFHACGGFVLAAAASACIVRQSKTNFHRICEAQTPGNSLSVDLSADYPSVLTAGGASDRR